MSAQSHDHPVLSNTIAKQLFEKIDHKKATIAIIGLGYVGLPLALCAHKEGFNVIGFDVDPEKVEALSQGKSYIHHISHESIQLLVESDAFFATTDASHLAACDVILMCVPTPLNKYREPDMSYVENTTHTIKPYLRSGQMVILESTTYPGTTHEVIRPILEGSGLMSQKDFFLSYSPEREDPGNATYSTQKIPKVVGGDGEDAQKIANLFYTRLGIQTVLVSSTATAEAVKLTENIFRCVNIALVNELKMVFDAMGVDIWEVINAAKTKPFGFMPFYPGPGLGGHCIPIDPFYLTWKAREFGHHTRFIELSGEINTLMPNYVLEKLSLALDERFKKGINGARVLIVGLAYKKNVDDIRETPSFVLMEKLKKRGAILTFFDSYVPEILPMREHKDFIGMKRSDPPFNDVDVALIATDHDCVDYKSLTEQVPLVVDTRNATAGLDPELLKKVVKA
jgi:UDP-N-acetyl-D-glucosamine dehydrogenase